MSSRSRPPGQVSKAPPSAPGDRPSPPSTLAAEAEIQYRALVEQSLVGIYLISADRFLYVNQAMADLFGYTREEMLDALPWPDTVHPADRDLAVEQVRIRLQGGTAGVRYSFRALRKDGEVIHCEGFGRRTEWQGQPAIVATLIDITERKRAEGAARETYETLHAMVTASPVPMYIMDMTGRVELWNPACERTFGWTAEEACGQFLPIVPPEKMDEFRELFAKARQGTPVVNAELRRRRKDGSPIDLALSTAPVTDSSGVLRGVVSVAIDITERKQTETAARESGEALRAVIESAPVAIYVLDPAGRVTLWNPGAERTFGWSAAEILGHPLPTIPEDSRAEQEDLLKHTQRGESLNRVQIRRRCKDGTLADVLLSTAPLRDPDGRLRGTVHLVADITEQTRLEDHLRQVQKLESIGQLAGGVAHDFNNLLSVIMGRSQLLLERLPASEAHRRDVQLIHSSAERAAGVARQLLAFGRRQVLEAKVLDLNGVVAGVAPMLKRLIGEHIDLVVHPSHPLSHVRVDRGQLEQVIMNLVVNARDAMPDGGHITVETANVELDEAYERAHTGGRAGPQVMLAVTDTGIGMDEATQARIFEPFFTTKEMGKGTGLGLATVYGIVKQSGGNIWVESAPGRGTTFRVYLPPVPGAVEAAESAGPAPQMGTETILLTEDEDEVRELAREILESYGYTVLEAGRPMDAIKIAETHPGRIDLLLTDVIMPQMSGRRLADRVRPLRPDMRVLYASGYPGDTIVQQGRLEPGTPYLPKPFTPAALAAKVREVLDVPS